jgi:predicted ferric reductase
MEKLSMQSKNNYLLRGILWVVVYTFLVITPLLIFILGPKSPGRVPLQNLAVGLAFVGLAFMALQFALTARIKPLNEPFGSDMVYYFHRQIGFAAFLMIFAHPILLFLYYPGYISYLNIFTSPLFAKAGLVALLLLIVVVWTAEFHSQFKIPYWFWKLWHGIVATIMVAAAILHIYLNGNFVNLPWKEQIWLTYMAIWMCLLVYTRIIYPIRLMRHPFVVVNVMPERANCTTLQLKPETGHGISFHPGQFAWLTAWKTPFSDSEHPFSLASSAEKPDQVEFTIKALGKFTATVKDIKPGDKVYVDGAYGSFSCDRYPQAKALILFAGGIGITPMMSTLRTLADRQDQRPLLLFYANRDWENVTFREEFIALEKRLNLKVVHILEKPPKDWAGETGYLTTEIMNRHIDPTLRKLEPQIFVCGPKPMMNAVEKQLAEIGFAFPKVHSERFAL